MFENVKTVEDMESELSKIREECREIVQYIDTYMISLKLDDTYEDASGYSRMMDIIEAKIQDMAG